MRITVLLKTPGSTTLPCCLSQFWSKTSFVGHFFSEQQKCFQLTLLLTRSLTKIKNTMYNYELIDCVPQADENAGNLLFVAQFLIIHVGKTVFLEKKKTRTHNWPYLLTKKEDSQLTI